MISAMNFLILLLTFSCLWAQSSYQLKSDLPSRLKVQRTYIVKPGDRTIQGKIYRPFPGIGLSTYRPRPNFVSGYERMPESLYDNPERIRTMRNIPIYKGRIDHSTLRPLNRRLNSYKQPNWNLKYFPAIKPNRTNPQPNSPFH